MAKAATTLFGTEVVNRFVRGSSTGFVFIGTNSQRESSMYMYRFLVEAGLNACEDMYDKQVHGNKRAFKNAFLIGFGSAIQKRASEIEKTRGTQKNGLVRANTLPRQYLSTRLDVSKAPRPSVSSRAGLEEGEKAGTKANFGNSLSSFGGVLTDG